MKRFSILSITLVAMLTLVLACSKNDGTHCTFESPAFILVNYESTDVDTIILRRYTKDNSFTTLVDTAIYSKGELKYTLVGEDSAALTSTKASYKLFTTELFANDWEIYLPGVNETSRISNVKGSFPTKTDPGEPCKSFVKSMVFEGSERNYITWFGDSYRFYMSKKN